MFLVFVALLFAGTAGVQPTPPIADDPFAPLNLYNGKWDSTTTVGGKEAVRMENHCAKTSLFLSVSRS